jgi:hypothetical protein
MTLTLSNPNPPFQTIVVPTTARTSHENFSDGGNDSEPLEVHFTQTSDTPEALSGIQMLFEPKIAQFFH